VELHFAHTYLLLFGKLAAGGLLSLAVPPFAQMERGFFKSTAIIYLLCGYLIAGGELSLALHSDAAARVSTGELFLWWAFAVSATLYCISLYTSSAEFRARAFPISVLLGSSAVAVSAFALRPPAVPALAGLPFAVSALTGSALAGGTASGMFLGHWYLIESGLELAPLERMLVFCRTALRYDIVVVVAGATLLWLWPGNVFAERFSLAFDSRFVWLVVGRVAAWSLTALILALITRTLRIPQTMAATGLFYIGALVVAVGEILSHWLLFRVGLPL